MKKIMYINAFGPREGMPNSGIFVTKRIQALANLNIKVEPKAYYVLYPKSIQYLLKRKGIPDYGEPLSKQLNVEYQTVKVDLGLYEAVMGRFFPKAVRRKFFKAFIKEAQAHDIELIHMHGIWPLGIGLLELKQKEKIPYVLTCHGSEVNVAMKDRWYHDSFIKVLEGADCVEFVSQALLNTAVEQGYSGKNARVVLNGIDAGMFFSEENQSRSSVGFVGNLIPIKGADRLPEIFRQIQNECKQKIEFTVVGEGPLRKQLEEKMQKLSVTFTGQLTTKELAQQYRTMKVLVVPSRNEGFSCVTREAQASGVIPVGTAVGGLPEAIGNYGCAIKEEDEKILCKNLAEAAAAYLNGDKQINTEEMAYEAAKGTWEYYQRESIRIYEAIQAERI